MTTHRHPHPGDEASSEHRPATTVAGVDSNGEKKAVTEHRNDDRAFGGMRPASTQTTNFGDRMLLIRRRVADRAYDRPAVIALVARAVLDSGDLL
jgi:hypothetical protein